MNDETDEYLELVRLEDEFEAMCDDYDVARRGGNYNLARRLGKEIRAFARRHQQTIKITDEQIDKLTAICRGHEAGWRRQELDNDLKRVRRELKKSTEKYHQLLLEEPPQGRRRTEH